MRYKFEDNVRNHGTEMHMKSISGTSESENAIFSNIDRVWYSITNNMFPDEICREYAIANVFLTITFLL